MQKPIHFSTHARQQMLLRGAEENEVIAAICHGKWLEAKRGKLHAETEFQFAEVSPINNIFYIYKIVDAIFADKPDRIEVITVKVYYHN